MALHITGLIVEEGRNVIGLGKHGGNILTSMQAALLEYITCT